MGTNKKQQSNVSNPAVAVTAPSPNIQVCIQPIALDLKAAARVVSLPVWTLREAVLQGRLRAKHGGRSHIIRLEDLQAWVDSLDDVEPSQAPSVLARQATKKAA